MQNEIPTITLVRMYLNLEADFKAARREVREAKEGYAPSIFTIKDVDSRFDALQRFPSQAATQLNISTDDFIGAVNLYTEDVDKLVKILETENNVGA